MGRLLKGVVLLLLAFGKLMPPALPLLVALASLFGAWRQEPFCLLPTVWDGESRRVLRAAGLDDSWATGMMQ